MKRMLVAIACLVVAAAGCSGTKSGGGGARPASGNASTCGRKPLLCVDGFQQCTTDSNGCETCTCSKAGGYNSLDPRMPP